MKLPKFEYIEPDSLSEARGILSERGDGARLIAGGTALCVLMQHGLLKPSMLVALRAIEGLSTIELKNGGSVRIGAMMTHRAVETSPLIRSKWPLLSEAYGQVASVPIRNIATVGGNIAYSEPATDPAPALLALEASAEIEGPWGGRMVRLEDFYTGYYENILGQGEIITAIEVPPAPQGAASVYLKYRTRSVADKTFVGAAVLLRLSSEESKCEDIRIALSSVAPTPLRARSAEHLMMGKIIDDSLIARAAHAVKEAVDPIDDIRGTARYKRDMSFVIAKRAIELAFDRGKAAEGRKNISFI